MRNFIGRLFLFTFFLLFAICPALAQQFGQDYLGAAKFCDVAIANHPVGQPVGAFAQEFGDFLPCAEKFIRSGKTTILRIQLKWKSDHNYTSANFKEAANEAKRYEALQKKYPNVKIFLSGACEHNLNASQATTLMNMVKATAPSCGYVNVPWKGAILARQINEVHGDNPKKPAGDYFVSFDGTSAFDSDVTDWAKKFGDAKIAFIWGPRYNGRQQGTTAPPKQRTGWPDKAYIESAVRLTLPEGTAPAFSVKTIPWIREVKQKDPKTGKTIIKKVSAGILKTHAEDKVGNKDPRANRLMIIIPDKVSKVDVITSNNKVIEQLPLYGSYSGGGYRYYSARYGYQQGQKAKEVSGSEFVAFRAGKNIYGPSNPAFRDGVFR